MPTVPRASLKNVQLQYQASWLVLGRILFSGGG